MVLLVLFLTEMSFSLLLAMRRNGLMKSTDNEMMVSMKKERRRMQNSRPDSTPDHNTIALADSSMNSLALTETKSSESHPISGPNYIPNPPSLPQTSFSSKNRNATRRYGFQSSGNIRERLGSPEVPISPKVAVKSLEVLGSPKVEAMQESSEGRIPQAKDGSLVAPIGSLKSSVSLPPSGFHANIGHTKLRTASVNSLNDQYGGIYVHPTRNVNHTRANQLLSKREKMGPKVIAGMKKESVGDKMAKAPIKSSVSLPPSAFREVDMKIIKARTASVNSLNVKYGGIYVHPSQDVKNARYHETNARLNLAF